MMTSGGEERNGDSSSVLLVVVVGCCVLTMMQVSTDWIRSQVLRKDCGYYISSHTNVSVLLPYYYTFVSLSGIEALMGSS